MAYVEGTNGKWEYLIGLEIHAQINSKAKLFSCASTEFGADPNTQVSLIDAAMPGTLPILNEFCVKQAIKSALGLKCRVNLFSAFDRKNYFYPDLPHGYQISQFYYPIAQNGFLSILNEEGKHRDIRINRLHIEQDAGKSVHDQIPGYSLIDLNRAGIGLMEIVTEPDIFSPLEAAEFIKRLRNILRYLETCDGDMEKGSLRCDANVSVRRPGDKPGTRCEIKNLNSIRNIIRAIEYEGKRQVSLLESGQAVSQDTMLFDADLDKTFVMRSKEDALDYRYFPDPDLMPLVLSKQYVDEIKETMPELPHEKVKRYTSDFKISEYEAEVIASDRDVAKYFEIVSEFSEPKGAATWITSELFGHLNKNNISIKECKIIPENLAELINLIMNNTISGKIAKTVLEEMFYTGKLAKDIINEKGLVQIVDEKEIEGLIDKVLIANAGKVDEYKAGKEKLFGFFVGQVMKESNGRANPDIVNNVLKRKLQ